MGKTPVCGWKLERAARKLGALRIAGVDEVGRGPMFGPVVAAAVILAAGTKLEGLTDSKQLSEKKRQFFDAEIRANAVAWAIAEVDAETIDRINIRQASLLAMHNAVEQLALSPDYLLIDGVDTIDWPGQQKSVIHGDATSLSIAAASVLAKVYRDKLMVDFDRQFPGYGLANHKGYCSREHMEALARLGPTPYHRKSYSPVAQTVLRFDIFEDEELVGSEPLVEEVTDEMDGEFEDELAGVPEEATPAKPTQRYACPCCGCFTLQQEPPGTGTLCEVCSWEDDAVQFAQPDFVGGANAPSLNQAQENYRLIGVSDPQLKGQERPPRLDELPELRLF